MMCDMLNCIRRELHHTVVMICLQHWLAELVYEAEEELEEEELDDDDGAAAVGCPFTCC